MYIWITLTPFKMKKLILLSIVALFSIINSTYSQTGFTCNSAIQIPSLPYLTNDSTANYGDTTDISQPLLCGVTSGNYMTGNDVFYSYTPTTSGVIAIKMSPLASYSGIFVYAGCENVGVSCIAGVGNNGTTPREISQLSITAGQTYIIVISTYATPQTVSYSLNIQNVSCLNPTLLTTSNITVTSTDLGWNNDGSFNSWEVKIQAVGLGIPTGSGTPTNSNNFLATNLSPSTSYEYWVRTNCNDGTYSLWSGPKLFSTKIANDECEFAIPLPVNTNQTCTQSIISNTIGATQSILNNLPDCYNYTDDDVWFSFVATSNKHIIKISNTNSYLFHTLYSGNSCSSMTQLYCSPSSISLATNLVIGNTYKIRVYTNSITRSSGFNICISVPADTVVNDECTTALPLLLNDDSDCGSNNFGTLTSATASPESNTCFGTADDDVWFYFTATSIRHSISFTNILTSAQNIPYSIYTGNCGNLELLYCEVGNINLDFVIGQIYYIRVWSSNPTNQVVNFNICLKNIANCINAEYFCGSTINDPYIFPNTTNLPNTQSVACLGSIPNATFYTLKVNESGPLNYKIIQNTAFNNYGNPIGTNLDVDFSAWGPFSSYDNCEQISFSDCPTCPSNNINPPNNTFYPLGNIVDCSYSASYSETLTIPNAIAGEYYKVLITNYSDNPGFIKLEQTNFSEPNSGKTSCSDKILLIAFVDINNNGIKDINEYNFTFGTFNYQINNTDPTTSVTSSQGKYSLFDTNPNNTYDFTYEILPEYANYYTLTTTNFYDINISEGGGTHTLFFPVTVSQDYSDVVVSITPFRNPIPGSIYSIKIVYKNLGVTPTSGTLALTKDILTLINYINQSGIVNNPTGFTYDFINLAPNESRSITVYLNVPPIPIVNLNDLLTSSVSISGTSGDINLLNNFDVNSQIVSSSYDPNDKMEAHGGKILISNFSQNDYLNYTIRFQNTGNSNAVYVRLEDLLDSRYDFQSIRMIDASHNYTLERVNNHLVWRFENIQLKPAVQNEELSKGFVTFKIKLNPGFAVGNIIPNTANIYFDSNPAITTNTFNTEFVALLANASFNLDNILVYPNPTNDFIHVKMNNSNEKFENIVLYNVLGESVKKVTTIDSNQTTIDVSDLTKGVYLLEITSENKLKLTKKLVIK